MPVTTAVRWSESHIASLLSRGTGEIRYKGPQGAVVQLGMAVMAHNGAALMRIRQQRLLKRAPDDCLA